MDEVPVLHDFQASDRAELFDFLREVYPIQISTRLITQWPWRFETNPFTPAEGPDVSFIRMGGKIVGLSAGFALPMWMGGIECTGAGLGSWVVHPDYYGKNLWSRVKSSRRNFAPVQFGWSRLPPYVGLKQNRPSDPVRPLLRVLDAGPLVEHFTHLRSLASIGTAAHAIARLALTRRRRARGNVVRLTSFNDSVDRLWERARRHDKAMIVRDRQYLNWRYCQRPDATYMFYGVERGAELEGFLVARLSTFRGMQWAYVVDFLSPKIRPTCSHHCSRPPSKIFAGPEPPPLPATRPIPTHARSCCVAAFSSSPSAGRSASCATRDIGEPT